MVRTRTHHGVYRGHNAKQLQYKNKGYDHLSAPTPDGMFSGQIRIPLSMFVARLTGRDSLWHYELFGALETLLCQEVAAAG